MVYYEKSKQSDEPREDLSLFNHVGQFGSVWCTVVDRVNLPHIFVVAGVCGNMTGVPIAAFERQHRKAAIVYAGDFESGKCFVLQNGPRWCDYINAMQSFRKIDADKYQKLISLGRSTGISLATGETVSQSKMRESYEAGLNATTM